MSYQIKKERLYMMPTHFGPHCGPRQNPEGGQFILQKDYKPATQMRLSINYTTNADQLQELLPERLEVVGEPVLSVEFCTIKNVPWLAGRSYNTLGVRFRARYRGIKDTAEGPFLAVLWENMADPIITGREQLGFNKIYAELPEVRVNGGKFMFSARWDNFVFLEAEMNDLVYISYDDVSTQLAYMMGDGILHRKYIPRTGDNWDKADADYITLSPAPTVPKMGNKYAPKIKCGAGTLIWRRPEWRDMPTQFHIINCLANLEIIEMRPAWSVETFEFNDYRNQKILN